MLEIIGAGKWYGRRCGISGIDITVEPGNAYAVIGADGAGKSTLVRCISGVRRFDAGYAALDGEKLDIRDAGLRGRLGCLTDNTAFPDDMTVRDAMEYVSMFYENDTAGITGECIRRFGIDMRAKCSTLSYQAARKLALTMAVMHSPDYLILDEPTYGLDAADCDAVMELLKAEKERGAGILLTTTHISEAASIAENGCILENGAMKLEDSMEDLVNGSIQLVTVDCDDGGVASRLGGKDIEHFGTAVRFLYEGTPDRLIAELSGQNVRRLLIEEAPIDKILGNFYD